MSVYSEQSGVNGQDRQGRWDTTGDINSWSGQDGADITIDALGLIYFDTLVTVFTVFLFVEKQKSCYTIGIKKHLTAKDLSLLCRYKIDRTRGCLNGYFNNDRKY